MHDMLTWLESRETEMLDLAQNWADMNTFSANHAGLDAFSQELIRAFTVFSLPVEMIPLPLINTVTPTANSVRAWPLRR